jgi:thioester reductase-like protein
MFEEAAFLLIVIGQMDRIAPLYGGQSEFLCLLEAGRICQSLEDAASIYGLGLCQAGFDFSGLEASFDMSPSDVYLHALLGGVADWSAKERGWSFLATALPPALHQEVINSTTLRAYCQRALPAYMVPVQIHIRESLPLSANGKVDRVALSKHGWHEPASVGTLAAPLSGSSDRSLAELTEVVSRVAAETFGVREVPAETRFVELGADSLLALRFRDRLARALGRSLPATLVYDYPSVAAIVRALAPASNPLASDLLRELQNLSAVMRAWEAQRESLTKRLQAHLQEHSAHVGSPNVTSQLIDEISRVFAYNLSTDLQRCLETLGERHPGSLSPRSTPLQVVIEQARSQLNAELDRTWTQASPPMPPVVDWHNDHPILLTGATGFLGAYLLRDLLDATQREIFVIVRATSEDSALARVHSNLRQYGLSAPNLHSRVRPILADLAAPTSGLSSSVVDELANRVGLIIHAAAIVHHAMPYELLQAGNVAPLTRLLGIAAKGSIKPTVFISSAAIFAGASGNLDRCDEDELPRSLGAGDAGYVRTKLVCEHLVKTARSRGLPVRVFRPSLIFGTTTAPIRAEHVGVMILRAMVKAGAYPTAPIELDAIPVDAAARTVVALAMHDGVSGSAFNVTAQVRLSTRDVAAALAQAGYQLRPMPSNLWFHEAERVEPLISIYDSWLQAAAAPVLSIENTTREMNRLGLSSVATIQHEVLLTQIEHCIRMNEIPPPPMVRVHA